MSSKYHAIQDESEGIVFASRAERRRYDELRLLERAGEISNLRCQPRFVLQEAFQRDGKVVRKIEFVGDFSYTEEGRAVVEDVKSPATRTPLFEVKRKLFLRRFAEIELRIVES